MAKPISQSKTFCILPWISLEARADATMAVCCNSSQTLRSDDGKNLNASVDSLNDGFTCADRLQIQKNLATGVADSSCQRCWSEEKAGVISRRAFSNELHANEVAKLDADPNAFESGPRTLNLKFSNLCNQKCRTCGPGASTLWVKEMAGMFPDQPKGREINWGKDNPEQWDLLRRWLPGVTHLDLLGGEPFLIPDCKKVLALAAELGVAKNMTVRISSNGSLFPEKFVNEIFPQFKKVSVFLSLDGIGPQFEYMRHPTPWKLVLENYKKFKATPYFASILLTMSAFNIFEMDDILKFWREQGEDNVLVSLVAYPEFQSINILPKELKNKVAAKLFAASDLSEFHKTTILATIRFMFQSQRDDLWPMFIKVVGSHDVYRNENFQKTFPQYYKLGQTFFDPLPAAEIDL